MFFFATENLGVNLGFFKEFDRHVIEINPQSETLTWAKVTVVHPKDEVFVSWKIEEDNFFLNWKALECVSVNVQPKGKLATFNLIVNSN